MAHQFGYFSRQTRALMSSVANEGCQKVGDMQMRHPGAVERGEGESEREREKGARRRVGGGG